MKNWVASHEMIAQFLDFVAYLQSIPYLISIAPYDYRVEESEVLH